MKRSLSFASITAIALGLASLNLTAVDLRADDQIPPVPPGKSLPPPAPPTATPTPPSTSSARASASASKNQPDAHSGERLQKLTKELHLTAAQVAKIKPIFEKTRQQIQALRSGVSMSATQKRQQIRQILVSSFQQIRPILTSQQLQKWKQIRDEHSTTAART